MGVAAGDGSFLGLDVGGRLGEGAGVNVGVGAVARTSGRARAWERAEGAGAVLGLGWVMACIAGARLYLCTGRSGRFGGTLRAGRVSMARWG